MSPHGLILLALAALPIHDERQIRTDRDGARPLELPAEEESFSFVVFGDRTGGPSQGIEVLRSAVADTNLLGPDLVMTVGDLIQGYNTLDPWLAQMREYRSVMDGLAMPWFPVAGNHDVYWRGPDRPPEEHEAHYETHFGPLWYAFEHKGSWFVVLYSDEPNPATGERNFNKPECQRISEEQLAWLTETLGRAAGAEHVFVFVHHPRWIGRNYGDDWERVHARLVAAGNVSAVFGGHIHRMRFDPRDGIEYFALATVGGHQPGFAARGGYLHQYHVVTVRDSGVDVAAYPVGEALDPRSITGAVSDDVERLGLGLRPQFQTAVALDSEGGGGGVVEVTLSNPSSREVEVELTLESPDLDWIFTPGHEHRTIAPGATESVRLGASRFATGYGRNLRRPELVVRADYLAPTARIPLATTRSAIPVEPDLPVAPTETAAPHHLALDGESWAAVAPEEVDLPNGPFTLEFRVRAARFEARQGLVTKTETSEYGIFANEGRPSFWIHLAGRYVTVAAPAGRTLSTERWHHVAGVFDGSAAHLYVDGELWSTEAAAGSRTSNDLPLVVGGDVDRDGLGTSLLAGALDEIRLSSVARYTGPRFEPARRHRPDGDTLLLFHADGNFGGWLRDGSGREAHAAIAGAASVRPADDSD